MTVNHATFSDCKRYRYFLSRMWHPDKPLVTFCMLNPSTADAVSNDPTIERCQRRAQMMGYGGLLVVNLFALRSTDPKELYRAEDPVGPENNDFIVGAIQQSAVVICGWGNHGTMNGRGKEVLELIKSTGYVPLALKVNKDGSPAHPLYIGYKVMPKPMEV